VGTQTEPRTLKVEREDAGERLDKYLVKMLPGVGLERVRDLIGQGRVRIRGKVCSPVRKLWGGEEIEVEVPAPRRLARESAEGPPLPELYEDAAVVVVDKPAGLVVEPEGSAPSVVGLLAARMAGFDVGGLARPGVVHRLDRDTTGCLALARDDRSTAALLTAFQEKKIEKRYLALVVGEPPDSQRLEGPYGRDPRDPRRFTTRVRSARRAALSFTVRERFAGAALLEVSLETGRTHQIRVQLSEAGWAIVGDQVYGSAASQKSPAATIIGRQALHAFRLAFPSPLRGARIEVESRVPADLERGLEALRTPR